MNEACDASYVPSTYEEQIKIKFNQLKTMAGGGDDNVVQFAAPVSFLIRFWLKQRLLVSKLFSRLVSFMYLISSSAQVPWQCRKHSKMPATF